MPERLASKLREFPRGSLQLELGIQTFNEEVADRIQRIQQNDRIETNMRFLREETEAYIHADLIAGLPGEDMQSFAKGFDRLAALSPHEIQVGVLKRLRGTPIARHDEEWAMIYSPEPPYNLIENRLMSPGDMARIDAFAQLWDKICNSGNFIETAPLLWLNEESVFDAFMRWSDWYVQQVGQRHSIPLDDLCSAVFTYLTTERRVGVNAICGPMLRDYQRGRRRGAPGCLRPHLAEIPRYQFDIPHLPQGLKRQTRHLTFCATSN
ncbi:MAG: DUF4080 domain-containing protein [Verrucomicrobia bacterium]|nr:DUF4080 domain-containing protein [Verrucomicrobiota bacterium]